MYIYSGYDARDRKSIDDRIHALLTDKNVPWRNKLDEFISDTCKLAWAMTIQQPPMTFETNGIECASNDNTQEVIPSRNIDFSRLDEMVVHYYLEPTLMQGDKPLTKGRVVLHEPDRRSLPPTPSGSAPDSSDTRRRRNKKTHGQHIPKQTNVQDAQIINVKDIGNVHPREQYPRQNNHNSYSSADCDLGKSVRESQVVHYDNRRRTHQGVVQHYPQADNVLNRPTVVKTNNQNRHSSLHDHGMSSYGKTYQPSPASYATLGHNNLQIHSSGYETTI